MIRYAITYRSDYTGLRQLATGNQARRHYDTKEAADIGLAIFSGPAGLPRVLSPAECASLRVDAVECWEHGDAKGIYVREEVTREA